MSDETVAWLIEYRDKGGRRRRAVCTHNAIADYRAFDPEAKVTDLVPRTPSYEAKQSIPDGWKLVPVEPTADMVSAAYVDQPKTINAGFSQAYRVMLEAAPRYGA